MSRTRSRPRSRTTKRRAGWIPTSASSARWHGPSSPHGWPNGSRRTTSPSRRSAAGRNRSPARKGAFGRRGLRERRELPLALASAESRVNSGAGGAGRGRPRAADVGSGAGSADRARRPREGGDPITPDRIPHPRIRFLAFHAGRRRRASQAPRAEDPLPGPALQRDGRAGRLHRRLFEARSAARGLARKDEPRRATGRVPRTRGGGGGKARSAGRPDRWRLRNRAGGKAAGRAAFGRFIRYRRSTIAARAGEGILRKKSGFPLILLV